MKMSSLNLRPRALTLLAAPMAAAILMALPSPSFAAVELSINIAPPEIPVYEQPAIPGDGYLWTPGYWAYADGDYFWVPGTWVRPPSVGLLWTPGYWAYDGGHYAFRDGYWGPHIGFYGGVNYGYGYGGRGYEGGYWNHGAFFYNTNVNVMGDIRVRNVYERPVTNITAERVSFNGGPGGLQISINVDEQRAEHDRHVRPIADQQRQVEMASHNKDLRASVNHGEPAIAATPKAGAFQGPGVVKAGPANPEAAKSREEANQKTGAMAPERDNANARGNAQAKPEAGRPAADMARPDAMKSDEAQPEAKPTTASTPAQPRHRAPRPQTQSPREDGAAPMTQTDHPAAADRARRPADTRTAAPANRSEPVARPEAQPRPNAARPEKSAEPKRGEENSKKDDNQKQP